LSTATARRAWPEPPVTVDSLSASWRVALAAARDALLASDRCPVPALAPTDVRERTNRLTHEREQVAALLEADARTTHVNLVRPLTLPTASKRELGLPATVDACLFDLDGVLTPSADLHFAAWADTFDTFLGHHFERAGVHFAQFERFSRRADYEEHLHGRPRLDGVRAFLASRGITLPEGTAADPPGAETVHGLANRKNEALLQRLDREGVGAFAGSHRYLQAAADAGLACAVVSASANTAAILDRARLADLVDQLIDGNTMRTLGLRPKPAPDTLEAACESLHLPPSRVVAFETTHAGVEAARAAGMGFVVGVARSEGETEALRADVIVADLGELLRVSTDYARRGPR
jgi:beta-phosphoglucomutase-like phosphatase (HAD superfamily)